MGRYRTPPPDGAAAISNVQKRVSKLERVPRASDTSVDSGNFVVKDSDGVNLVQLGDAYAAGTRGWTFRRGNNGTVALALFGLATGKQWVGIYDNWGNLLISDDTASSGGGLARPYLAWNITKTSELAAPPPSAVTSGTFGSVWSVHGLAQHPKIAFECLVYADAATTGEYQILDTSTGFVLFGPKTINASDLYYDLQTFVQSVGYLSYSTFDFQVRRTSGAGVVAVVPTYVYGRQT